MNLPATAPYCENTGDILVAQLGARMHYAVPSLLAKNNRLAALYTDFYTKRGIGGDATSGIANAPTLIRRAVGRSCPDLPNRLVYPANGLGIRYALRCRFSSSEGQRLRAYLKMGRSFGQLVRRADWRGAKAVYAFNSAALEILGRAREAGIVGILEQTIAPKSVEVTLLERARHDFPEWGRESNIGVALKEFILRESQEWELANAIICPSDFVASHLASVKTGTAPTVVVPYGVDVDELAGHDREPSAGYLKVLCVGALGLRKGTPYLLEAAKNLGRHFEFRLVGEAAAIPATAPIPPNVSIVGSVPRHDVRRYMAWCDVFVLPSLCEGSATVIYEALAAGCAVVCTPNSGSVVRHDIDGLLIAPFSSRALVDALTQLADNPTQLARLREAAKVTAQSFTVEKYAERLLKVINTLVPPEVRV
jgi:glycosyltransferase involved in cell wall biosynthesis